MRIRILYLLGGLTLVSLVYFMFVPASGKVLRDLPNGWYKTGSNVPGYHIFLARAEGRDGRDAVKMEARRRSTGPFAGIVQACLPGKFLGKRVKVSAYLKTEDVQHAGIWFRVDGKEPGNTLSIDNMSKRFVRGSTGWKKYSAVLDVPEDAGMLAYGALMAGHGTLWVDDFALEVVPGTVAITGIPGSWSGPENKIPMEPENLSFDRPARPMPVKKTTWP